MEEVTVLTTTYNRAKLLKRLFDSLLAQESKEFVWIIIDDGSVDDTKRIVEKMMNKADFQIRYYEKNNGGKHTALNFAYRYIQTPLTFIVDSDDTLTSDAISTIQKTYEKYESETDLCGFSFLRGKPDGGYLSTSSVPKDGMKESYVECRINRGNGGDMAEVWYTHCLKEYPFPEFLNEKFLGEDLVWVKMSEKYKMRFFNHVIYVSEYLEDGLTINRRRNNLKSPNGCVARAKTFLDSKACMKIKIKSMFQYQIYGTFAGRKSRELLKNCQNKILFCIVFLPSRFIYIKWKKERVLNL